MKVSVKKSSDTKVELTITLDAEDLAIAEQVAITKLARDVKVPGFRKGKTPVAVAEKNVDPNVLQEQVINNSISKAVSTAFTENHIQALDRPQVEIKKFVPGESLEFTAETEVLPEVKLGNYKKLKINKEEVVVTEAEVDEVVERIQKNTAEKKEVKRLAQMGDETIIDFIGKRDGVAFDGGTGNDYNLTLGSGQFISGFEEGIVGHKSGDKFDLDLKFPDDYNSTDLKGTKVNFSVTLKAVKEVILPELDDKFAAKVSPFKTIAEMKTDVRREITERKEREADEKVKDDLVKQLVSVSKVPIPQILVDDQTKSIEQDFVNSLSYQGLTLDNYFENKGFKSKDEWIKKEVHEVAEKRVAAGLVLAELSKQEEIKATVDELDKRVSTFKQQYANNPEALKQFELPEVRNDIANRLLTEKTVDRLVELNTK